MEYKEAIPLTRYNGGTGRHAQGKIYKATGDKVAWPQKATRSFLDLLTNVGANAEAKGLDATKVVITHVNVNQAPKMRRRTYRAHGRINRKLFCVSCVERWTDWLFSLYVLPCSH